MTDKKLFEIENWDIGDIKPYELNAKKHPPEQVESLANSIQRLGWSQPLVIDKNGVLIAGHGRRLAALKLGLKRVPVICRRDLNDQEVKALRLADNKMASLEWDMRKLAESIGEIDSELKAHTGFSAEELKIAMQADFDPNSVVQDIGASVSDVAAAAQAITADADGEMDPIAKAFGFKRITLLQSRRIKAIMAQIEEETGKVGAEALIEKFSDLGY